ncbi:MAG: hypothetical protein KC589_03890 [Nanoarchaeota archaeon]|nr:hypothetical protein [Nanoarchaeota archaeon]
MELKLKNRILKLLKIDNDKVLYFRRNHIGYWSETYVLKTQDAKYLIKKFKINDEIKFNSSVDLNNMFEKELDVMNKCQDLVVNNVKVPNVLKIDDKNKIYVQRFIDGINLFSFLNKVRKGDVIKEDYKNLFQQMGIFLALFHKHFNHNKLNNNNNNCLLFGDLNGKNFLINNDFEVYFIDPAPKEGNLYEDLAQFSVNFFPFNFFKNLYVSKKNNAAYLSSFLLGYEKEIGFEISLKLLTKYIILNLENQKKFLLNSFSYKIKKRLINAYINYLIRSIKNGKISIKLYR